MSHFAIPLDEFGQILPHDHPDLIGDHRIIRRINSYWVVPDENLGCQRLSSAVFKHNPKQGHLSFDSERCILSIPSDPSTYVTDDTWIGALAIAVADFRTFDPTPDDDEKVWKIGMVPIEGNKCHGGVWGKISDGVSKDIQRKAEWLVPIPGVEKLR